MGREDYTPYAIVETCGQGLLGLMTCLRCGAALLIEKDVGTTEIHDDWHARLIAAAPDPPSQAEDTS